MQIVKNADLLPYNTFGIPARAAHFVAVRNVAELQEALATDIRPVRILGGGSNIVFTNDVEGLLIKNDIKGIEVVQTLPDHIWIKAGGGKPWHPFVLHTLEQGYGGLENLSLIPGTVGAAPIQNIGAYGTELKDTFVSLEAVDLKTGDLRTLGKTECAFGYRDSIFKKAAKGKYCIVSVTFALTRHNHPIQIAYGDIRKTLNDMGISHPGIRDISRAVIAIRSSKLPDPAHIGNCGSFFKNPETERPVLEAIRSQYPQAPAYDLPDGRVKIPAGWLIEQCGWKGKRVGNTGSYEKQALVLVNHGGATGAEVQQLAHDIIRSVQERFGITLEPEVNIW
jgi:UDP-N-acetylmuramate dehydrogenase